MLCDRRTMATDGARAIATFRGKYLRARATYGQTLCADTTSFARSRIKKDMGKHSART